MYFIKITPDNLDEITWDYMRDDNRHEIPTTILDRLKGGMNLAIVKNDTKSICGYVLWSDFEGSDGLPYLEIVEIITLYRNYSEFLVEHLESHYGNIFYTLR